MKTPKAKNNSLLLPFTLAFCLAGLASWLFIPWFMEEPSPQSSQKTPSKSLGELMQATQPDHVFFATRAHSLDSCNQCHAFSQEEYMAIFNLEKNTAQNTNNEVFYQAKPLNMSDCLSCHQIEAHLRTTTASGSCATCHR